MNVAYQADEFFEPRDRGSASADKYLLADRKFARRHPTTLKVETGIEGVGQIQIRTSKAPSEVLLEQLGGAIERLREIQSLAPGWDTYGAPPINPSVFGPAARIVLTAISRCKPPRLEASSGGGIDIIWEENGRALTITALSDNEFEALLTDGDGMVEPDGVIGLAEAQQLLDRFCVNR